MLGYSTGKVLDGCNLGFASVTFLLLGKNTITKANYRSLLELMVLEGVVHYGQEDMVAEAGS